MTPTQNLKEEYRLRKYNIVFPKSATEDNSVSTVDGLSTMLDALDGADDSSNTDDDAGAEGTDDPNDEGATDDDDGAGTDDSLVNSKSNHAFAEMRTTIRTQSQLLGKVAKALGIEYADNKELMDKLNDDALTRISQQDNVPKELLERLEYLEGIASLSNEQRLRENALAGFQKLHTEFGLDDKALQAFAAELDQTNQNPFQKDLDVVNLYKTMHFEDIVNAKVEKAVADALARDQHVNNHSTSPGTDRSSSDNSGNDNAVSTVAALSSALKDF